jgi:signal transduction histidine kinase
MTAPRQRTLFAKMWHPLLAIMLATFAIHAFLVTGTLQLGAEAQTARRLKRIGDYWAAQAPLQAPLGLDPVTVVYPRYELLPANIRQMMRSDARGLFELGNRAQDYFVLARSRDHDMAEAMFYVVEFHSEVKPNETIEHQVFLWYSVGVLPFLVLLLWLCKRITARVAAPMRDVGHQVVARPPSSLEPVALPSGSSVELEVLVKQINSALQRTADVLERERSFTEFASHELRNPAAVIQAALERIEAFSRPEQAQALGRAQRGLTDMHALIDTFLQLSGDAVNAHDMNSVSVDGAWLQALFEHISGGSNERPFQVDVRAPLKLSAPATMVHVLFANVLKNALFHGGPGAIEATISSDGVEVRNSLPDKPAAAGYGLGSQIARRICARCGWDFTLTLNKHVAIARVHLAKSDPRRDTGRPRHGRVRGPNPPHRASREE